MAPFIKQLFLDALEEMDPGKLVKETAARHGNKITVNDLELQNDDRPVYCFAAGKASRPMISALQSNLDLFPSNLLCITPDNEGLESYCVSSSHPVPDTNSTEAANKLVHFIEDIPREALIFFLLSGGASSLVCKPGENLNLDDIQTINTLLLQSGAAIDEINSVRKHVSSVKGGQLLSHFPSNCTLIDLVISDVPSDDLEHIGSGLTIPDSSTFQDAYDTLLRYDLWDDMPNNIQSYIEKGLTGEVSETLKPEDTSPENHHSFIIGSAKIFAEEASKLVQQEGFNTRVAENAFDENVKNVANTIIRQIKHAKENDDAPCALLFYGESTVNVTGGGKGGRNQELALRGALEIAGMNGVTWLSAGTDGIDGPTDAAGAIVDGSTISRAKDRGLEPEQFISDNNSYHFHEQMGTLLKTGPTGNNVMDTVIILIE